MSGLFEQEMTSGTAYICTRLSIIAADRSDYFTSEYFRIASEGLNTGIKKYIFAEQSDAEEFLEPRGAIWCIYKVNIPKNVLAPIPDRNLMVVNDDFEFQEEHIKDIYFHRLSPFVTTHSTRI